MKSWLPILLESLEQSPVLVLATLRNLARAAVFDRHGQLLSGSLGSPGLMAEAAREAAQLAPGQAVMVKSTGQLTLECLRPDEPTRRFWASAAENYEGAWGSWLLTMAKTSGGAGRMPGQTLPVQITRHLLSAFGPWTTPRIPKECQEMWSLLPLKAGLGRLFVLGDDGLALEAAALAARVGLTVTWVTTGGQDGATVAEASQLADFETKSLASWADLTPELVAKLGLKYGVLVLITTPEHNSFSEAVKEAAPSAIIYSGEAGEGEAGGLWPNPVTTTQKALGLIARLLGH